MKTYIWANDAGHEWLAVKRTELVELGIENDISIFSYVKGGTVYLEGDCDAARFFDAYKVKFGTEPKTKAGKHWDRWPGRSFEAYRPQKKLDAIFATPGNTLTGYVKQMNDWNAIFGTGPVTFPLTEETAQKIASKLDGELSPENLHCDGEISPAQAQKKYNFLTLVLDELNIYCDANSIARPTVYEA
jgi:hypothetical protein